MVGSIDKDVTVCDLRFMAFTWFELYFVFRINVPCSKQSLIEIGINSPDRKIQFKMVCEDLIGRLPLFYEG